MLKKTTSPRAGGAAPRFRSRLAVIAAGALAAMAFPMVSSAVIAAPSITAPASNAVVSGITPVTVRGSAPAGSSVQVVDAVLGSLGTVTANAGGTWSLSASMGDGTHTINATASNEGETSPPSAPVTFEVDAVRPTVRINSPDDGHAFGAGEPLRIEGSASDERTIHTILLQYWRLNQMVYEHLAACEDCGQGAAATWRASPALEPGLYVVRVHSYDQAGNRSATVSRSFVVSGLQNASAITPPTIPGTETPDLPDILEPDEDDLVPGASEETEFSGTTEPGSTVELYENVAGLGKIGVAVDDDGDGRWSVGVKLPTGDYGVQARTIAVDGGVSQLTDLITFSVDAQLPSLANLTKDGSVFLPTQDVLLEGTALDDRAAFAVVLEYWLGDKRVRHELAECPACGEQQAVWQHRPQELGPGYYHVKMRAIDAAGQRSSVRVLTFTKLGV